MQKTKIIASILIALLPAITAFSQGKNKQINNDQGKKSISQIDYKKIGSPLPKVRFVTLDGKVLTNENLASDGYLIIMLFRPDCDHCQEMTRDLQQEVSKLNQTKIVLVSGAMMEQPAKQFYKDLKMEKYPSMPVTIDSSDFITNVFLWKSIPQINIYDSNRKLVAAFTDLHGTDSLQRFME